MGKASTETPAASSTKRKRDEDSHSSGSDDSESSLEEVVTTTRSGRIQKTTEKKKQALKAEAAAKKKKSAPTQKPAKKKQARVDEDDEDEGSTADDEAEIVVKKRGLKGGEAITVRAVRFCERDGSNEEMYFQIASESDSDLEITVQGKTLMKPDQARDLRTLFTDPPVWRDVDRNGQTQNERGRWCIICRCVRHCECFTAYAAAYEEEKR